jgi:hypothetical protein
MKFLTLWIPAACLVGSIINTFYAIPFFYEEMGIIENLTVIFLISAMISLLVYGFRNFKSMEPLDKALLVVLVLGSIYFAGEELSWGQHFLGFETSESVRAMNYQKEMNLHNSKGLVGDLLDKIPRNLLTVGIFIGGIVFPFCRAKVPAWIRRYVPGKEVVFVSVLAVFVSVPEKFFKMAGRGDLLKGSGGNKFNEARFDGGEMKEMYIALFILLFTIAFLRYVKARRIEKSLIA